MSAHIGGNIKITVGMEGQPPPTITWYKDGFKLASRGNVFIDKDDNSTWIQVKHASREDDGEYKVVAKNEWGSKEQTFRVHVTGSYFTMADVVLIWLTSGTNASTS